jgi:hypothetical protein
MYKTTCVKKCPEVGGLLVDGSAGELLQWYSIAG